jgi:MoaA/NifB/PqqE/SkfB family radical SAM enzyme
MSRAAQGPSADKRVPRDLAGIAEGRPLIGPSSVHVDITNGCNTNCVTCWDHSPLLTIGKSSAWKRQRVDLPAVRALLDDAQALGGLRAVILSGMGEPFTHPDIEALIADVKGRGLALTIITNLVAAEPSRIVAMGVDDLLVGIHGATEAAYLAFHPNFSAAHWERLLGMLRDLQRAGFRAKHVHVICNTNAHELVAMVEQGADLAAKIVNFKLASLRGGTEAARISGEQLARLVSDLPVAQARAEARGVATNLDVFGRQLEAAQAGRVAADEEAEIGGATAPIDEVGCFMGYAYARVLVDGTVLYCCNTEVVVGSLARGDRFRDLWEGAAWQATRDRMRRGDYLPSCSQCGKIVQNVKVGERFERAFGRARRLEVIGRGGGA